MLAVYAGLIAVTFAVFWSTPAGFIPAQDQGYALAALQLPPGTSLERTDAVLRKVVGRLLEVPGTQDAVMFAGFDGASGTQASNAAAAYVTFKPFDERADTGRTDAALVADMRTAAAAFHASLVIVTPPPLNP